MAKKKAKAQPKKAKKKKTTASKKKATKKVASGKKKTAKKATKAKAKKKVTKKATKKVASGKKKTAKKATKAKAKKKTSPKSAGQVTKKAKVTKAKATKKTKSVEPDEEILDEILEEISEEKRTQPKDSGDKEGKTKSSKPKSTTESEVVASSSDEEPEVIITDAEGRRLCKVTNCDQVATVEGYCRYHYLLFWKRIQIRKKIISEGKLEKYIEELTSRYPMKYLEMLKKDLKTQQDFLAALHELEIDEAEDDSEFEDETQSYIEEVRGISSGDSENDDSY